MGAKTQVDTGRLTPYEAQQVEEIAAWKSRPPNPVAELWKMIVLPVASVVEKAIPDRLVSAGIDRSYTAAALLAGQKDIMLRAGLADLAELRDRPLEECDRLAKEVGAAAVALATVEGAVTGAGGVWTTLIDVPVLFVLALRTILRIGHCYGYALDDRKSRHFVVGVLVAAVSGSLHIKRNRLDRLREIKELVIEETQEEILTEELVSFLFQLEIFEEVPGLGAISGGVLNFAFLRRVDRTSQRVFQERWLRDNGKVDAIKPAPAHPRHLVPGVAGVLGRAAYSGCYAIGFGMAVPVWTVAALIRPVEGVVTRGLHQSAETARSGVNRLASITGARPIRMSH